MKYISTILALMTGLASFVGFTGSSPRIAQVMTCGTPSSVIAEPNGGKYATYRVTEQVCKIGTQTKICTTLEQTEPSLVVLLPRTCRDPF